MFFYQWRTDQLHAEKNNRNPIWYRITEFYNHHYIHFLYGILELLVELIPGYGSQEIAWYLAKGILC